MPNLHVYNNQVEIVSSLHLINLINNNFTYIIGTKNIEPGTLKIIATYGQQTGQTELKVISPQSIISEDSNPQATETIAEQEKNSGQNDTSKNINTIPVSVDNVESKLIKYENSKYSFSLLHPSNWTKSETNLQPNQAVTFYLTNPIPTGGKSFPATLLISVEPAPDNTDIEVYPDEFVNSIFTDPSQFKIIKHTEGLLAGNKLKE